MGIHVFSSLRHGSNLQVLTLACNLCEASPRSLFWIPDGLKTIPEVYFEFPPNLFDQSNMWGTQLGDPEQECWHWLTYGLNQRISFICRVS